MKIGEKLVSRREFITGERIVWGVGFQHMNLICRLPLLIMLFLFSLKFLTSSKVLDAV
jgi:hypothetical protein